jgi:Fe-S cluster biosynthesis and repair protein YggX
LSIYNQQLKDLIERNNKEREENTFKALPTENQVAIKKIQDGSAGILKIKNILDAEIGNLTDKNLDIDQKIAAGKNILKSLNSLSVASPDAVSAEEVDRLAGFLKFHIFPNLTEPGPVFGRDLNAFIQQVGLKSSAVEKAILANDQIIDSLKQGKTIYDSISKTGLNANVQKAVNINNKQTGMTPQQKLQRKQFLKQKATI